MSRMRANLLVIFLVLAVVAVVFRTGSPPQPPNVKWEASFWLQEPSDYGAAWIDFEDDRYKECLSGCTSSSVAERGRVKRKGGHLELFSENGVHQSYSLVQGKLGRVLRDSKGRDCPERDPQVPRIHPQPEWLRADVPFELSGVRIGMSRAEILQLIPSLRPNADGSLTGHPYPESPEEQTTIAPGDSQGVSLVRGVRLSQAGRMLLNECNTRRDLECLFGRLRWSSGRSSSHGYAATAYYRNLKFEVYSLVGMEHGEAHLTSVTLTP